MKEETSFLKVHISKELFRKLNIACAIENKSKSVLLSEIVKKYVSKYNDIKFGD